jgi:hypothetical protein
MATRKAQVDFENGDERRPRDKSRRDDGFRVDGFGAAE